METSERGSEITLHTTVGELIAKLLKVPNHYGLHISGSVEIKRGQVLQTSSDGDEMGRGIGSRWISLPEFLLGEEADGPVDAKS